MARVLRWGLAYFGTIFVLSFAAMALIWVSDGFVGELWAVAFAPIVFTPLVGGVLLIPTLALDWVLVAAAWDSTLFYAAAGALMTLSGVFAWSLFDGDLSAVAMWRSDLAGLGIVAVLGAAGGALFRHWKGKN